MVNRGLKEEPVAILISVVNNCFVDSQNRSIGEDLLTVGDIMVVIVPVLGAVSMKRGSDVSFAVIKNSEASLECFENLAEEATVVGGREKGKESEPGNRPNPGNPAKTSPKEVGLTTMTTGLVHLSPSLESKGGISSTSELSASS